MLSNCRPWLCNFVGTPELTSQNWSVVRMIVLCRSEGRFPSGKGQSNTVGCLEFWNVILTKGWQCWTVTNNLQNRLCLWRTRALTWREIMKNGKPCPRRGLPGIAKKFAPMAFEVWVLVDTLTLWFFPGELPGFVWDILLPLLVSRRRWRRRVLTFLLQFVVTECFRIGSCILRLRLRGHNQENPKKMDLTHVRK